MQSLARRLNSSRIMKQATAAPQLSRAFSDRARELWRTSDAVCFDVDSTVCTEEGIDVLADSLGVGEQVADLTKKAMEGGMTFQDAIEARLSIMKPSLASLEKCLEQTPATLSPKIDKLVDALHKNGKQVFLVSGGFRQMIEPVATKLGVSHKNIVANVLLFDDKGEHAGFDKEQPTSRSGGKARVVNMLIEKNEFKNVIMVGDGATDMEARPPAAAFVGYGGVVERAVVKEGADWFVKDFQELIDALDKK